MLEDNHSDYSILFLLRKNGKSIFIRFANDKDLKHYLFNFVSQSPSSTGNPVTIWKAQLQSGNSIEWKGPGPKGREGAHQ